MHVRKSRTNYDVIKQTMHNVLGLEKPRTQEKMAEAPSLILYLFIIQLKMAISKIAWSNIPPFSFLLPSFHEEISLKRRYNHISTPRVTLPLVEYLYNLKTCMLKLGDTQTLLFALGEGEG